MRWNHDRAHYRCVLAAEYALANDIDHPKSVYVRESAIVGELDQWIAGLFDPASIDATCAQLAEAQGPADEDVAAVDARLAPATTEAGADLGCPVDAEVQGER